jgi:DNA-binding IclR family transcriptional regulator
MRGEASPIQPLRRRQDSTRATGRAPSSRTFSPIGDLSPFHATATGLAVLAYMSEAEVEVECPKRSDLERRNYHIKESIVYLNANMED